MVQENRGGRDWFCLGEVVQEKRVGMGWLQRSWASTEHYAWHSQPCYRSSHYCTHSHVLQINPPPETQWGHEATLSQLVKRGRLGLGAKGLGSHPDTTQVLKRPGTWSDYFQEDTYHHQYLHCLPFFWLHESQMGLCMKKCFESYLTLHTYKIRMKRIEKQ